MSRVWVLSAMLSLVSCDALPERVSAQKQGSASGPSSNSPGEVGEEVRTGPYVFEVAVVEDPASIAEGKPDVGSRYVAIEVIIRHASGTDNLEHFPAQWQVYDRQSHIYTYKPLGPLRSPELKSGFLFPNTEVRGWVTFEVPVGAELARVHFLPGGLVSPPASVRSVSL